MWRTSLALVILLAAAVPVSAADFCPHATPPTVDRAALYHVLSQNAESLSSPGKRRSVRGPSGPGGPLAVANFIDSHIGAKQTKDGVIPTALAGDEEFLRRVTLDLTGAIPTAAQVTAFVADTAPDKRARKIDELLRSDAFVDRWTMWFGDLVQNVQVSTNIIEYYLGKNAYYNWIKDSIRNGKPYDAMVREVLSTEGMSFNAGAANYVVRQIQRNGPVQDTLDNMASHSIEKFFGMPALCISCHDGAGHLEQVNVYLRFKTRKDFWRTAAFFSRTTARPERYSDPANPNANIFQFRVAFNPQGLYQLNTLFGNKSPRLPKDGEPGFVTPAFLTTGEEPKTGENYRVAYARMLTADRQFARATVNYLWKEMFGLGLVEPVNAFDLNKLKIQPTHPDLLEALADELIAKNYSLRELLRTIALSNTYQLSAAYTPGAWNEAWVPYYARRYPRRLMAEMLFDAVTSATSLPGTFNVQGIGPVQKAMQLPDPLDGGRRGPAAVFLNNFGRGNRDENPRSNDSAISQALALMNDPTVTVRVKRATANSTMSKVLAATSDPGAVTDQLYLATLSRRPTGEERQKAVEYLQGGPLTERAEDLQFALINSLEFLFN